MTTYRSPGPLAKLPPCAPWYRILRAAIDGTLLRLRTRRRLYAHGIIRDLPTGLDRFPLSEDDIVTGRRRFLRRLPPPKGPTPRPANLPE